MNELRNFSRYDAKGNRLAIFGYVEGGLLHTFCLRCNRHDSFSKKLAVEIYKNWSAFLKTVTLNGKEYHPDTYTIPIEEGDSFHWTFQNWCNKNYYKKVLTNWLKEDEILYSKRIVESYNKIFYPAYSVEVYKLTKHRK